MSQITDQNQEAPELLSLKLDAVLKLYFARKENEEQLRQFLKATVQLSDDSLATIEIKNPTLTKQHVQEKDFIVDIHLTSATGELIILEMQVLSEFWDKICYPSNYVIREVFEKPVISMILKEITRIIKCQLV